MPFADIYRRQVALLIRLLPLIAEEKCFALKGGTAIPVASAAYIANQVAKIFLGIP
jgi:hypothetical protein